jgi:general secretion pathway protein A
MTQRNKQHPASSAPPNPKSFPYNDYLQAKSTLINALKGDCFYATLLAASGMGKTELLKDIRDELDNHRHQLLYLTSTKLSLFSLVQFLAVRFHVGVRRSYLETVDVIAEYIHAMPSHMVIWLDEADQLSQNTLQELRTLAEHRPSHQLLLSFVLSGLPDLNTKLETPALFPLERRISLRCTLTGLCRNELDAFVEHRFGNQQAQRIPKSGRDEIFERTQATPALIDLVVHHALSNHKGTIELEVMRAVLDIHGL